ncbi:MAG: class I SAM-dependent methyltransferase [Xanthobacteraceae bacterium]|nr:class I SAM-dependent methyltransferase [Xanthobacteraceae bacterium]
MSASDWIEFWDSKHSIYVNARHEAAHFRRIAEDIRPYAPAGGTMLDYGCGAALAADRVAEPVARLILCEPAPNVRGKLGARFAGNPRIAVRKPEDVAVMPAQSMDVIVIHSVTQYLSPRETDALLKMFRRLLKPGGLLVIGDVIPRKTSAIADARALLRFGRKEGFFVGALRGLVRTYFSDYWRLRKSLGLARYDEAEIVARLEAAGFLAERARSNIGHNDRRMTFLGRAR